MTEPRKRTQRKQPKKPQPKYPDLGNGLNYLGFPPEPYLGDDAKHHPWYNATLRDMLAETK